MIYRILIFVLLLSACSSAQKESNVADDNIIENYVDRYPNGLKKMEGKMLNGKRHGKWIAYHENGFKWSEGVFREGKREGSSVVYYENGKKKLEGQYMENLKVGIWKVWEDDGTFVQEINLNELLSPADSVLLQMKPEN